MSEWERQIELAEDGQRLDRWAAQTLSSESRSRLQGLIRDGYVRVNGVPQTTVSYKLRCGDVVHLTLPAAEPLAVEAEDIPLDIIYEDASVLVVNKPRGMVVHPAPGNMSGTLVNALLFHCHDLSGINGVLRPGIVHRIDKDTSGLLMIAKNDKAHHSLAAQLKDKTTMRRYQAIVHGVLAREKGTIDASIGRDSKDRKKMAVTRQNSKRAVTHFKVLRPFAHYTWIECRLETGRTHQIRVHMAYIGHPLAGDPKYGPKHTLPIHGQALHAADLGFTHPDSGEWMSFHADPPEDFKHLLTLLETGNV
ncbi:MAG: RluA family pseudouridine synthase [Sporolactobacillus sp.]